MIKSNNEVAKEVIDGKWGSGPERNKKLEAAGYDYNIIQRETNDIIVKTTKSKKYKRIFKWFKNIYFSLFKRRNWYGCNEI